MGTMGMGDHLPHCLLQGGETHIYLSIAQSKEPVVVSPMLSNVGLCWAGMFPHSPYKGCGRRYSGLMKKEGDDECSQSPHQLFELYM